MGVTPSVPVKANSGVRARVPAAGKVLEGDDQPTLLREDQHYLHYITINNNTQNECMNARVLRVRLPREKIHNNMQSMLHLIPDL